MTWMTENEFRKQLRDLAAHDFYQEAIFNNQAYVFRRDHDEATASRMYDRFRERLANYFGVSRHNICLIGSGKTGYSLNPGKKLKLYDATSDIDVVIVSPRQFDHLWNVYIRLFYIGTDIRSSEIRKDIFRQFVSFKQLPQESEELVELEKSLGPLRRELEKTFYISSEINFRIYHNWEAVELYHLHGIEKLKRELA